MSHIAGHTFKVDLNLHLNVNIQDSSAASRELGEAGQGEDWQGDPAGGGLPYKEGTVPGASCSCGHVSFHGHP